MSSIRPADVALCIAPTTPRIADHRPTHPITDRCRQPTPSVGLAFAYFAQPIFSGAHIAEPSGKPSHGHGPLYRRVFQTKNPALKFTPGRPDNPLAGTHTQRPSDGRRYGNLASLSNHSYHCFHTGMISCVAIMSMLRFETIEPLSAVRDVHEGVLLNGFGPGARGPPSRKKRVF